MIDNFIIFFGEILHNNWFIFLRDIIDVALVSYFIYRILLLIKGTRAVHLIKGVLLLFAFYFVVNYIFQLKIMSWLMQNIATLTIFSLPIVFQPELRRMLTHIGQESFTSESRVEKGKDLFDFIKKIVDTAKNLSNKKHGALIIIEKSTGLNEFIETGIKIDADISPEILESIFFPDTPLHDGAVIISNRKVKAASVLLPLSENIKPVSGKHNLGTRHRAGLGLSEVTDAICIIVSEETRDITVAYKSKLHRHLSEESLEDLLLDIYQTKNKNTFNLNPETLLKYLGKKEKESTESTQVHEKSTRKSFNSNWVIKLGALLAASIFMLILSNEKNIYVSPERNFLIPVEIRYDEKKISKAKIIESEPAYINIKVSGNKVNLDQVNIKDFNAFVNIDKVKYNQTLPVSLSVPTDVTIKDINPKNILIKVYDK